MCSGEQQPWGRTQSRTRRLATCRPEAPRSSEEGRKGGRDYFGRVTGSYRVQCPVDLTCLSRRTLSHSEPSRGCAGGRFSRSRPPLSLQPCLLSSAATCIFLMVFNLTRSGPTPGPLHWLCLLPRTLFPRCLNGPCPHFLPVFSKRDLFLKKKKKLKKISFTYYIWLS